MEEEISLYFTQLGLKWSLPLIHHDDWPTN